MYTESISNQNISTFKYTDNFQQSLSSDNNSLNSFGNKLLYLPEKKSLGIYRNYYYKNNENTPINLFNNNAFDDLNNTQNLEFFSKYKDHKKSRLNSNNIMKAKKRFDLLIGRSVHFCGHTRSMVSGVNLESDCNGNSNLLGVVRCNSIYQCNYCQQRILTRRQQELDIINNEHLKTGGGVYLVSLTVKHSNLDGFSDLLGSSKTKKGLLGAYSQIVSNSRSFKSLLDKYKIKMSCRAFESTWGLNNGFHVHLHCLYYMENILTDKELLSFKNEFHKIWVKAVDKAGLKIPDIKHGVDIQDGSKAGKYIAKWSSSNELSSGSHKKAKNNNFTINQLENFLIEPDIKRLPIPLSKVKKVLSEYYKGCRGKRFLTWSDKEHLKKKYLSLVNQLEKTDNQILENSDIESNQIIHIGKNTYNKYFKNNNHIMRSSFELGSYDGLMELSKKLNIPTNDIHFIYDKSLTQESRLNKIESFKLEYSFFPVCVDLEMIDYFILNFQNLINIANEYYFNDETFINTPNSYYSYVLEFCNQYKYKILKDNLVI